MLEQKRFGGILNTDDANQDIAPFQHVDARNIRFTGGQQGLTAYNIKGNFIIANANLPSGDNENIGAFYDSVKKIIIWFNWNSNDNHGIYKLDIQTGVITQIFRCGVSSATDILRFSLDYPVASASIVYRPEGDGDLLYWTDGNTPNDNKPRYLNLDTVASLQPFTEVMINVAKVPPLFAPTSVSYTSVAGIQGNRVWNKFFRFAQRWVYKDFFKSTFSPPSLCPVPPSIVFPNADVAPNTNNAINLSVISAPTADQVAIEVYAQEFINNVWSDFFLINVIDSAVNSLYNFNFFNNGNYDPITTAESGLRFDYVPDIANTLELLNGNSLIYGGITEGYAKILRSEVDVQVTTTLVADSSYPAVTARWKWQQYQRLGLIYFDKWGKTNGVISFLADTSIDTTNFDITTGQYNNSVNGGPYSQIPRINASISHLPPDWAESFAWVRADLTPPFFLQYVTNNYQTDTDYIYLCIQSLVEANTTKGFVPSYEFKAGDMCRIMAKYNSTNNTTVFTTQLDFQILDVVTKTMTGANPPSNGSFLKLKKPTVFPTPAYSDNMLIEIYTPPAGLTDSTAIFYEWQQQFSFTEIAGQKYHNGNTQDQTASVPALFQWTNGDVYCKDRQVYTNTLAVATDVQVMDRNFNDYQASQANSNSRGWPIEENAKREYFPVTSRWGRAYVQDTNINELNRFYPQDLDTIDRAKGDIRRFKARDRILRVFQDRGVGEYGIYARFIQNNEGVPELVTTDEIITTNNIKYYKGTVGLGGYPTNLCSSTIADYFVDVVTGREQRLSGDGITDLGLLYKGQFYLPSLVVPYNKEILRTNGAIAKVMKFWDSFENEAHTILQGGTVNESTITTQHYSFNELRNGFCCKGYDYNPEWALSADDLIYSWTSGATYKHDSVNANGAAVPYCNWYGTQYTPMIKVVFNGNLVEKKTWEALTQVASKIWKVPTITTNSYSYGTTVQQSELIDQDFTIFEGNPSASFLRDSNSQGSLINGDSLHGNWIMMELTVTDGSELVYLSELLVLSRDSPLTSK